MAESTEAIPVQDYEEDESDEDESDGEESMLWEHKTLLQEKEAELSSMMNSEKMLSQLIRRGVFAREDREVVNSRRTTRDKNGKIIQFVMQRGPKAFDIFFQSLNSIDEDHVKLAEKLQPVKHRILWFTSSPKQAAAVSYCLEKYSDTVLSRTHIKNRSKATYLLRRGRIFNRELSATAVKENPDLVPMAQDAELYLAFPISERGDCPSQALRDVFTEFGDRMDIAVMSGVCVGVRGDSEKELGVRGGEVVFATEAVTMDGGHRQLPLSSALSDAKMHLSQLTDNTPPKWLQEAKERLAEIPNRVHPRLLPHFDTIRQDVKATPTATRLPRALAIDTDTFPFYELCTRYIGLERPWFSCKGAISYSMLNNLDPSLESSCSVVSSLFSMETCRIIVEKRRQSQK